MPTPRLLLATLLCAPACAPAQQPQEIPFEFDGHIFLHATINDLPARLLFDPVDGVMLDRRFVLSRPGWHRDWRSVGAQGPTMVGGAGAAEVEVTFADSVSLTLGPFRHDVPRAYVIPLDSMMSGAIAGRADGLFGTALFHDYAVQFDFQRRVLQLHQPGAIDTTGWTVLPLTFVGAKAVTPVTVWVGDTVPYQMRAQIDLGMSPTFRVSTREVNRRNLMRHAPREIARGAGLGGTLVSRRLDNVTITLGGLKTGPLPIDLAREPAGGDADPPYDALLGLGLLSRFDVIYDPTNARMLLREPMAPDGRATG